MIQSDAPKSPWRAPSIPDEVLLPGIRVDPEQAAFICNDELTVTVENDSNSVTPTSKKTAVRDHGFLASDSVNPIDECAFNAVARVRIDDVARVELASSNRRPGRIPLSESAKGAGCQQ